MPQPLGDRFSACRRAATIVILGLLIGLDPSTIDLYLPIFPALKTDLGVTNSQVQVTLSVTTLGSALGQFVVGLLNDRLGHQILLIVVASLHVASSVLVAVASNVTFLTTTRALQGIGVAGGVVVSMVMIRDLFSGRRPVVMLFRLVPINGLAPTVAPLVGSWVVTVMNWCRVFWALASYGAVLLVPILSLIAETRPPGERTAGGPAPFQAACRQVLGDRVSVDIWLTASYCSAGLFSYILTSSLLLQEAFGLRETELGVVFAICSIGVLVGVQLESRLSAYLGPQKVFIVGTAGMTAATSALLGLDVVRGGHIPLILAMFAYTSAFGACNPAAQVLVLQNHRADSGAAASLMGALNMTLAAVVGPVIGQSELTSVAPMAIVMLCCAIAIALCLQLIVRSRWIEFAL